MDSFGHVHTYEDLLRVNESFLIGAVPTTPYHNGPLNTETHELVGMLQILHQYGFLSVCGQPARVTQKSFIEGYLPRKHVVAWILFFKKKYAHDYYLKVHSFECVPVRKCSWICGSTGSNRRVRSHLLYDNFPLGRHAVITLFENTRQVCSTIPPGVGPHPGEDFHGYPVIQDVLIADTVKVVLAHRQFNVGSVESVLIDFFISSTETPCRGTCADPQ